MTVNFNTVNIEVFFNAQAGKQPDFDEAGYDAEVEVYKVTTRCGDDITMIFNDLQIAEIEALVKKELKL